MRGKKRLWLLWSVLIGLACVAGVASFRDEMRRRRVERAIAQFERQPSQRGVDELAGLLEGHAATAEQGGRILALLTRRTIIMRRAYAAGRPVGIALERSPFRLNFRNVRQRQERIWLDDKQRSRGGPGNPRASHLVLLDAEESKPGTHRFKVRRRYSLIVDRQNQLTKLAKRLRGALGITRLPLPGPRSRRYECELALPVEVIVVAPEEAETVELIWSRQLDEAMWETFSQGAMRFGRAYWAGSSPMRFKSLATLRYEELPTDVAFRVTLRVSDDQRLVRYTGVPRQLRARAGSSGTFSLSPWVTSIDTPGTYRGSLVLTADPNIAYEDPSFRAIWDGELEFPVAFTVVQKGNGP